MQRNRRILSAWSIESQLHHYNRRSVCLSSLLKTSTPFRSYIIFLRGLILMFFQSRESSRLRISISSPMRVLNGHNGTLSDEEEEEDDLGDHDHSVATFRKKPTTPKRAPTEPPKKMGTFDAKNQTEYSPPQIVLTCNKCKKEYPADKGEIIIHDHDVGRNDSCTTEFEVVPSPFDKKYLYECSSCTQGKLRLRHLPKSW